MTPTFSLSYTRPMINSRIPVLLALLVLLVGGRHVQAQENQKLAQTGMKFLSMSHDPRAAAMADAVTSVEGLTSALFYNPAAMSRQRNFINVMAGQTQWIAGIDHQHATLTMAPSNGRWGVFGFSIQSANYGDMQETVRWDNEQGFIDLGTFSPSAYAIGFGYARAITDRFSVGGAGQVCEPGSRRYSYGARRRIIRLRIPGQLPGGNGLRLRSLVSDGFRKSEPGHVGAQLRSGDSL